MKKSILTLGCGFVAGAACAASVVGFSNRQSISPQEFLERSTVLLAEVADIGAHVAGTRDGRVFLREPPPIACIPPPNPKLPEGAVPIAQLKAGIDALIALNEGRIDGEQKLATLVGRCYITGD